MPYPCADAKFHYEGKTYNEQEFRQVLKNLDGAKLAKFVDLGKVPDMPMAKTWHELAFKRALRWAAENGYERMTWTTGEQQAERFDLSKQVDEITYGRVGDKYWVGVSKDGREITRKHGMTLNDVEDFIGKEMAQKIERGEGESTKGSDRIRTLTGDNLKIGGEGMKGFYDQILPAFASKYVKKWGAKVGETRIDTDGGLTTVHAIDITPEMRKSVMAGQMKFRRDLATSTPRFTEWHTVEEAAENARFRYRPAANRPGALYLNEWGGSLINELLEDVYGPKARTTDTNFTIDPKDARNLADRMADMLTADRYSDAQKAALQDSLTQFRAAIDDAVKKGHDVAVLTRKQGESLRMTKIKVRHETTHASQSTIAADLASLTGGEYTASTPYAQRIANALDARGYAPESHDVEAAAFVASGDEKSLGLTPQEGADFLVGYFDEVVKRHGNAALKRFGAINPRYQPILDEARNETTTRRTASEGRQQTDEASRAGREQPTLAGPGRDGGAVQTEGRGSGTGSAGQEGRARTERRSLAPRFSVGALPDERPGTVLGGALGVLQGAKLPRTAKERSFPLPSKWDGKKWTVNAVEQALVEALPKAQRERYDAAQTKADKRTILAQHSTITNEEANRFADALNKVQEATAAADGGALYDAVSDVNEQLGKIARRNSTLADRLKQNVVDATSLPRALMASVDLSAPLRQGAILTLPPSQWGRAAKAGVRMMEALIPERIFGKDVAAARYKQIVKEINLHPDAESAKEAGLFLSTDTTTKLGKTEEDFVSRWAGRIPLVAASERAYKTYLDSLRIDTFSKYKRQIDKVSNLDDFQRQKAYKAAAEWINTATGRGSIHKNVDQALGALSPLLFAPRYSVSRFQVLNPWTYAKNASTPEGRVVLKQQMSDAIQYGGMVALTLALAHAAGASVGLDPDDPDFLKIRVGNTRYDGLAGLQQPMRLIYRVAKDLARKARGQQSARGENALEISGRFLRSKLAPIPSYAVDAITQKDFIGRPFDAKRGAVERVTPLFWRDFMEAYGREGAPGGIKMLPGLVGVGVQDYEKRTGTINTEGGKLGRELKRFDLQYDYVRPEKDEPASVHKTRADRVEKWMSTYGQRLVEHPAYASLTDEQKKEALTLLRRHVGAQMNLARPNEQQFSPALILRSVRTPKKPGPRKLWEPPAGN